MAGLSPGEKEICENPVEEERWKLSFLPDQYKEQKKCENELKRDFDQWDMITRPKRYVKKF